VNFNGDQVGWLAHIYMAIEWVLDQTGPPPCRFVFGHYWPKKRGQKKYMYKGQFKAARSSF